MVHHINSITYPELIMSKTQSKTIADQLTAIITVQGARDANVGAAILKAGKAAASMLQHCKEAAALAAKQLNPEQALPERIKAVTDLYAADFATAGHNVRALFVDALTLHAAASTPVTVDIVTKGKKVETHTTAEAAASLPKHAMRDAASQVRAAHGMGRKAGGGRKQATPKAAPVPQGNVVRSEIDAFTAWLDDLPKYLGDAVYHPRIVAALIEAGYSLNKAAKGVRVRGKAAA
jgi:hypothetical protein